MAVQVLFGELDLTGVLHGKSLDGEILRLCDQGNLFGE
jgi:hypothetical protein